MASVLSCSACVASSKPSFPILGWGSKLRRRWGSIDLAIAPQTERRRSRVVAVVSRASRVVFRDLDADDFRHPLDKQNTLLLRTIPGLNELGKALLGPVTEQVMLLENIGTSVLVSEKQLPDLHKLIVEAAKVLNTDAPDLYVRQNPMMY